jgi:hypothetical protein
MFLKDWAKISNNGSQLRSYYIHLLVTTTRNMSENNEIVRVIILAAPNHWFIDENRYSSYEKFYNECLDLANNYGIALTTLNTTKIA